MAGLFGEVLALCADAGLVGVAVLAVDGTKVHASASQHQNLDYDEIARQILAEADAVDRAEDERFGDRRGDELPPELSTAQGSTVASLGSWPCRRSAATARASGAGRDHGTSMDDGPLPVRPSAVVTAYLLAALCVLIPLAVVGSTFAGIVLWRRGLRSHGAAVVGLGVACGVFGVAALR